MAANLVVSAAEANRSFSKLLRAVREGKRVTITSHGEPVAEIGPVDDDADRRAADKAWAEIEARWATCEPIVVGPWSREEIYDEITR